MGGKNNAEQAVRDHRRSAEDGFVHRRYWPPSVVTGDRKEEEEDWWVAQTLVYFGKSVELVASECVGLNQRPAVCPSLKSPSTSWFDSLATCVVVTRLS